MLQNLLIYLINIKLFLKNDYKKCMHKNNQYFCNVKGVSIFK